MMMSHERSLEIQNWLNEKLTVQEAEACLDAMDKDGEKWGISAQWLDYFNRHFRSVLQAQDELWLYDSGPDSWAELRGENGLALVRSGQVINAIIFRMNQAIIDDSRQTVIHYLTLGHLDPDGIKDGRVVVKDPLDMQIVMRLLDKFGDIDQNGNVKLGG